MKTRLLALLLAGAVTASLLAVMVVSVIFAATAAEAKSTDNGSSVCPSVFILSRIDGVIGNSELKAILHIIPKVSKINSSLL